ncbi:MAG: hypothetical protein FWF30_03645, partial [Coriobacteriia bacterium]|nr:hypothetical protein [Coriobacteriia bacterium]
QQAYEHLDKAFTAWLGDFGGGDTDFSTRIGLTDGMTEFDVIDAFQALELDNPLILDFFNGTVRLTLTNTSVLVEDVKTSADEQVFGDIGEVRQRALAVQYMADSFLAGLDPGLSDYQKYWYIAQKLAAQSTYDYAALAFYDAYPGQMPDTNALWLPTSIYGTLAWNTAICQGLTASYQYLCQRAGLFCMTVTGTTKGGSHAWNVIKLDDGYYNVDVTWMLGGDAERYFCLTDAQIRYDHTIDADGYPACQGSEYAYQGPLD